MEASDVESCTTAGDDIAQVNGMEHPLHYFWFTKTVKNFLFEGWNAINSLTDMIPMFCTVGVMVILLEIMKTIQVYLRAEISKNPITYAMTEENMAERPQLLRSLVIPSSVHDIKCRKIKLHCTQTLVHILHVLLGYFLMLSVMTYNAYIAMSVVVSSALGFCLFGAVRHNYFEKPKYSKPEASIRSESGQQLLDSGDIDASMQSIHETRRQIILQ